MGFWLFMLIMDLLIPFTMIVFGKYFVKNVPKEINAVFGYRTAMSMKNKDTWESAHKYCGNIWYKSGYIMLPVSVAVIGTVGGIISAVQLLPLVGSVIPTEIMLKKTFDENGNRR